MFNDDRELCPMTYSIRGYRAKNTVGLKQIIKIVLISAAVIFSLFITALTLYDMA